MSWTGSKFDSLGNAKFNRTLIIQKIREDLIQEFEYPWKFCVSRGDNDSIIKIEIHQAPRIAFKTFDKDSLLYELCPAVKRKLIEVINAYNFNYSNDSMFEPQNFKEKNCNYYYQILFVNVEAIEG